MKTEIINQDEKIVDRKKHIQKMRLQKKKKKNRRKKKRR